MKNWKVKSTKLDKGQYLNYRIRAHSIKIDANGLLEFYDMGIVVSSFSSDEWFICDQTNVFGYTKKSHCNPFQFAQQTAERDRRSKTRDCHELAISALY